jgi:heterodisulfide reductase subunit A
MKKKIGVYICHCGGNISDYVDVEKVKQAVGEDNIVFLSKTTVFACADSNQKEMVDDIKNNELDGVIVASCSPKLHQTTFRAVTERAGLNKYSYVHANIREQVSWAHSDMKKEATEKAIQVVKAAIAKVQYAESLDPIKIKSEKAVAVIGAGLAGMKAALELSKMGSHVYLIERDHFVGGRVFQWDSMYTSNESGSKLIERLYSEIRRQNNITLFTGAELVNNAGSIGNFTLTLKVTPRCVTEKYSSEEVAKAVDVCPVSVDDEHNFGITKRKAIFPASKAVYPQQPAVDMASCTRCGSCEKVCSSINFSQKEEILNLNVGSILMATGFDPYKPELGEFGYGNAENVITLPQLKRLMSLSNEKLVYKGKEVRNIAYIYCVGSRQPEGENKYCSRYCCTSTIHTAIDVRNKFKGINNFHFTRGVRTYGKQELLYREASSNGDIFLQSYEDDLPVVAHENGKTIVRINDILLKRRELEVEADLVVLVTGMTPRKDNSVGNLLKLPKGRDKFFNEIHMKLRPVETVIDGITIAGTCQGPKSAMETANSALSAAAKSYSYVSKGELEMEPIVAEVNKEQCTWCTACTDVCPFSAIEKAEEVGKSFAVINNSVCKGCGMCLPVCPTDAIELLTFSNREIESMIDALAND